MHRAYVHTEALEPVPQEGKDFVNLSGLNNLKIQVREIVILLSPCLLPLLLKSASDEGCDGQNEDFVPGQGTVLKLLRELLTLVISLNASELKR